MTTIISLNNIFYGQPFAIMCITILLCALICGFVFYLAFRKYKKINKAIDLLKENAIEMSAKEFLDIRNARIYGKRKPALAKNFEGVYILCNKTKNMYYVGQGKEVLNRVNSHLTGRGNGDVYADFKYGDEFTVSMIALENSGYDSLNSLEKDTISRYKAYYKGYNKTRGNRG